MRIERRFELLCLLPLLAYLAIFTLLPVLDVLRISLTDPVTGAFSIGNFAQLLREGEFRAAFGNTMIIALGSLAIEVLLGLILALTLSVPVWGGGVLKSLLMLPLAIPTVVAAVMMSYLFATSGWLNRILMDIGVIAQPVVWLDGSARSLFAVMAADCWKVTPLVMLILLAGLQSIDRQLYAAAKVDGARAWTVFRRVTLPLLMPSLTTAVIIRGIDAFRIFALALVLTGENLKVIGTYAYLEYTEYHNEALSAAAAVCLFLLILGMILLYIRVVGRKGFQTA